MESAWMSRQFPNLMSPANIGKVEIRNRIVTAPLWTGFADRDGSATPRMIAYYSEKAKGGAGLVIIEYAYIDRKASQSVINQLGVYDDSCMPGLAQLAQAIHDWGATCAVQICHAGAMKFIPVPPFLGPSDGFHDLSPMGPLPAIPVTGMSKEEISGVIKAFATAAGKVKHAGFDIVEIHGAHGYLLTQFLSPHHNRRTDEYGGSLENRMRFPLEVVLAVRQRVGPDFPVTIRISGTDYEPESPITIEESLIFAKRLEDAGIDALHVSGGSDIYMHKMITTTYQDFGFNVYLAEAVKKRSGVNIPIIASGGITKPDFAEEILSKGKADFIALGRPSLADPHWGRKLKEGRPEDIIPCIRCYDGCSGRKTYRGASCSVNPLTGHEQQRHTVPAKKKKKVAVIGGGPGGMEAARHAFIRGHDVTLYERRELGGAMIEACWDSELKPDIGFLLDYYRSQVKKLKIKVINAEAKADTVVNGGYEVAIVANGAIPQKIDIPGIDKPHVYEAIEVLRGKESELGKKVIVVGGGVIAAEIAASQAMKGKEVIMTAPEGGSTGEYEIAGDAPTTIRMALLELLKTKNVEIHLCLIPKEITDEGVISIDKEGNRHEFRGDSIIICRGFTGDKTLANALKGKVKEVLAVGDCVASRQIYDAIHEGWMAANQI